SCRGPRAGRNTASGTAREDRRPVPRPSPPRARASRPSRGWPPDRARSASGRDRCGSGAPRSWARACRPRGRLSMTRTAFGRWRWPWSTRPGYIAAPEVDTMDLSYTRDEEDFRARVRGWLADNVPPQGSVKTLDQLRAWQRKLHAAGFLGAAWPKEYGGAGLSEMQQAILNEEMARARAPQVVNAMAIWWVGPAIMRYGTDEQKRRFIAPILTADEIWATGYSEPSSGSDMAAAKTKAVRDGDHYVVTGQKVWTTLAHVSDWFFVLVRTSSEGPKWAGLTLLLMDMRSPGVEVRPIRQIDGSAEFNEVFMTDVRVPVANRLGAEGQGWEIVSSALVNERTGIAGSIRFDHALEG